MITKFWDGVGSRLADRWAAVAAPALIFWAAALFALLADNQVMLRERETWLARQPGAAQAVLLLAGLTLVAGSGLVVERITLPVLRLVEGYWPSRLDALRDRFVHRQGTRMAAMETEWTALAAKLDDDTATSRQRRRYVRLDQLLRGYPSTPDRLMPSRTGNLLRAAESRPLDKYGLDAVKCWPHLWLLLPETSRKELAEASASMHGCVTTGLWGLLFLTWTPWAWWAFPAGLMVFLAAFLAWLPVRASRFADLVETCFDLHRRELYRALRWPQPENPAQEHMAGERLTRYLWRGSDETQPTFTEESS